MNAEEKRTFIKISNKWFGRQIKDDNGLYHFVPGWINELNECGHIGLFVYSLIKQNMDVRKKFYFNMLYLYSKMNLNPQKNYYKVKKILNALSFMQSHRIINCFYMDDGCEVDFTNINHNKLIITTMNDINENDSFTMIFDDEIGKILNIESADIVTAYSLFAFIVSCINEDKKAFHISHDRILKEANFDSEKTIITYKSILEENGLIIRDNAGLKIIPMLKDEYYCRQFPDSFARPEHKEELGRYVNSFREKASDQWLKTHNRDMANKKRSIKVKIEWIKRDKNLSDTDKQENIALLEQEYKELDNNEWGEQTKYVPIPELNKTGILNEEPVHVDQDVLIEPETIENSVNETPLFSEEKSNNLLMFLDKYDGQQYQQDVGQFLEILNDDNVEEIA